MEEIEGNKISILLLIKSLVVRLVPRKAVLAFCRAVGQLAFTRLVKPQKTVNNLSHIYGKLVVEMIWPGLCLFTRR